MLLVLADEMGIIKATSESDVEFYNRISYSAVSRWMLAGAWETRDGECGTVMHVKQKAMNKLWALEAAMEGRLNLSEAQRRQVVEQLWYCHEKVGTFYREPYRVTTAVRRSFAADHATLVRSPGLYEPCQVSGAAFYHLGTETDSEPLEEGFSLLRETPEDILKRLVAVEGWITERTEGWSHYFNPLHHLGQIFYGPKRPRMHTVLAKETDGSRYYLLSQGRQRCFTDWEQREGLHWAAMCALQGQAGNLLATVRGRELISIQINCRMPQRDESLFQYCSWFCNLKERPSHFKFLVASALYPCLRRRLMSLGFTIREEAT